MQKLQSSRHFKEIVTSQMVQRKRCRHSGARPTKVFTARRCVSAMFAVAVRLFVCLSQFGVVSKWLDGLRYFFRHECYPWIILQCVKRESRYLQK